MLTRRAADHAAMRAYLQQMSADNSALYAAFRAAFFEAMHEVLTQRQYEALYLHYIEDKSQREIADLWEISPSAVCQHIGRAKKRLSAMLSYNLEWRGGL